MWNASNRDLCARFGPGKPLPQETDYGTYIARELMALGYAPKQIYVTGQPALLLAVPVMGGTMEAALICRSLPGEINGGMARSLASLRSVHRAARYAIVTTARLDDGARQYLAANRVPAAAPFMIGDDVAKILDALGLVPGALLKQLTEARNRAAGLEKKLYEAEQSLAYQEEQTETALRAAGGAVPVRKQDPARMTGAEKFRAGLMDPLLPQAMFAIAGSNATSAGVLVKKLRCTPSKAEALLAQLEEMEIVTHAEPNAPRFVKMTKAMMEKAFGVSGTGDEYLG